MELTRVVLVRHAEGQYSVDGIVGGPRGCSGLSDEGRRQGRRLHDRLTVTGELAPDVLLASTLPRAIETATALADVFGGLDVRPDCAYCEVHVGEADGLSLTAARERWEWPGPWETPPPGAESVEDFGDRVARAIDDLVITHQGQSVVLVTHGGFISAACYWFLGVPWQAERGLAQRRFFLDPIYTAMTEWTQRDGTGPWTLVRYNDAAHLRP